MRNYAYVALGSAAGGLARLIIGVWVQEHLADALPHAGARAFPVGTLVVNITGSFLIGVLLVLMARHQSQASTIQYLLVIGLCGGYTTFSSFSADTVALLESGGAGLAALNVAATLALGFAATYAGFALTSTALRATA